MLFNLRVAAALVVVYLVLQKLLAYPLLRWRTVWRNSANGCQPAPRWRSKDPFFSFDRMRQMRDLINQHALLPAAPAWFAEAGSWTIEVNLAGRRELWIAEPENVKAILQTRPRDWRTADSRRDMFLPIFGQNIITSDGDVWHETRSVMRPAFAKKYFEDFTLLDMHVTRFLDSLSRDEKVVVDLRPQITKLTMDFSTNFLFGFSTNSLAGKADAHGDAFGKAFDDLQTGMLSGQHLGKLGT
jgi:cytochrome P450